MLAHVRPWAIARGQSQAPMKQQALFLKPPTLPRREITCRLRLSRPLHQPGLYFSGQSHIERSWSHELMPMTLVREFNIVSFATLFEFHSAEPRFFLSLLHK